MPNKLFERNAGRGPKSCGATFGPTPGSLLRRHKAAPSASTQQRRLTDYRAIGNRPEKESCQEKLL